MTVRIITGLWGEAWERYGRNTALSFAKHWPKAIEYRAVTDRTLDLPRGRTIQLNDCSGYTEFMDKWGEDPEKTGDKPTPNWRRKALEKGYDWRHDAVKWFPQSLCVEAGIADLKDGDTFAWVDGDVETHSTVPKDFLIDLIDGNDIVYIGRSEYHSEIGFWGGTVNERSRWFAHEFAEMYRSGRVFDLSQWHSAWVFDAVMDEFKPRYPNARVNNLTADIERHGQPFEITPLAKYMTHYKGRRKEEMAA